MKTSAQERSSPSKASFDALLGLNAEWFEWIDAAVKFENLLKDKIPWEQLDGTAKEFVTRRFKSTAPARQILLNSFYLTMVSGFEEYLRTTIQEITRKFSRENTKYEDVPEEIRKVHVRESAKLLRRLDSPPDYLVINVEDLCRGLGSCVPKSNAVVLNPEAFSEVEGLIKLQNFIDRLKTLGKQVSWDILGSQQPLKDALNLPKAKARQVSKALEDELGMMARYRNRIAHTGGSASEVTVQILSAHRALLQSLASAIETTM